MYLQDGAPEHDHGCEAGGGLVQRRPRPPLPAAQHSQRRQAHHQVTLLCLVL